MKMTILIATLLVASTSQAEALFKCFDTGKTIASLQVNDNFVSVNWNINSKARINRENGTSLSMKESYASLSFDVYLSNQSSDGSSYRFIIDGDRLSLQGLTGLDELIGKPLVTELFECPIK